MKSSDLQPGQSYLEDVGDDDCIIIQESEEDSSQLTSQDDDQVQIMNKTGKVKAAMVGLLESECEGVNSSLGRVSERWSQTISFCFLYFHWLMKYPFLLEAGREFQLHFSRPQIHNLH